MPNRFAYPRPEYPRPDRQRGTSEGTDWLNLNGPWQFRFDGDARGADEKWFDEQGDWREQIIVPFCWESLAAWGDGDSAGNDNYYSTRVFKNPLEVTRANHRSAPRHEIGWYRRRVTIPGGEAWAGKRVILTIGAADFFTDCWVNGQHLGHHEGGYTPFEFDITDALANGGEPGHPAREALIVLRVADPMVNHEQPVGKQWKWYTTTSGIWQTVFIEPRGASHIQSFRIFPDIDKGEARFEIDCENAVPGSEVLVELSPPGAHSGEHNRFTLPARDGLSATTVKVEPLILWDPNSPHLYDVKFTLRSGGEVHDVVRSYFGMRKIDFEQSDNPERPAFLRLNGVARYLRGALYQSYHPDGVYTASDVQVLKNDIEAAKKFGFNFLRAHIKVDDPLLYYWADKLGMLFMADMPNFGEGGDTPLGRRRWEAMMREAIKRDFNHPSIFSWCIFNETWGFGGQVELIKHFDQSPKEESAAVPGAVSANPDSPDSVTTVLVPEKKRLDNVSSHKWVHEMWQLTKQLDPTRLIEDMSVCHWDHLDYFAHTETDINSWHFYINDYAKAKEHIRKIVESTYHGSSFNYVQGFAHKGTPLINSEYGGIGALDGDCDMSWSFKFLTNELRRYQQISAYIYTELHDVEWEYNGFLNYDRTPKEIGYDPRIINESDALPIDAPPVTRMAPGEETTVNVASSHYSTLEKTNIVLHWRLGGMDTRGRLHQDLARGTVPIAFPHRRVWHAHTIPLIMPNETMLCSLTVEAKNQLGTVVAQNCVDFFVSAGYPQQFEEGSDRTLLLRGAPSDWSQAWWSEGQNNREQARREDQCWGQGHGFYEWNLPLHGRDIARARRIRVICEASSHRTDTPQTDEDIYPTTMQMFLNDVRLFEGVLRNHPHDSRGVLSYLRGAKGAYGYLVHAHAERETLQQIAGRAHDGHVRFRCAVPEHAMARGGLTIYGSECGHYPVCPTIIVEF